jgi:hypothetical protein
MRSGLEIVTENVAFVLVTSDVKSIYATRLSAEDAPPRDLYTTSARAVMLEFAQLGPEIVTSDRWLVVSRLTVQVTDVPPAV